MFNLRSTEDCDPEDDLLNEFLNCDDLSEGVLSSIDHVASKELPVQSEPGPDGGSTLRCFSGENSVPSNEQVPSNHDHEFANGSTDRKNANSAKADGLLNRLFREDEDDQYSSNLNNDQLILNSKVSDCRPMSAIQFWFVL